MENKHKSILSTFLITLITCAIFIIWKPLNISPSTSLAQAYPPPPQEPLTSTIINYAYRVNLPILFSFFEPNPTNSYYVFSTNDVWGLGCNLGNKPKNNPGVQDNFVFLDFGNPNQDSQGNLGTVLYNSSPITADDIASASVIFANGFFYCSSNIPLNAHDTLTMAIGTNSSGGLLTDVIAYSHGTAWSNLIIEVNERFLDYTGLTSRVIAVGGINIEPGFNPVYIPTHWLNGYESVTDVRRQLVYIIGSADWCPTNYPPSNPTTYTPQDCYKKYENNQLIYKWTQEDVYYVNWGKQLNWPYPEIYNSATADQWYRISLYSAFNHANPLFFKGSMTQLSSCQQLRIKYNNQSICSGTDFSPIAGFMEFFNKIDPDQYTKTGNILKWATDMENFNME